jgi:hypothetical protein
MRITSSGLRQIIKEEISKINEAGYRLRPPRLKPGQGSDLDPGPYDISADPNVDRGDPFAADYDPRGAEAAEQAAQQRRYDTMMSGYRSSGNAVLSAYKAMDPKPMGGRRIFILDLGGEENMGAEHLYAYTAQTTGVGRGDITVKMMPGNYLNHYFRFVDSGKIPANVYFFDPKSGIYRP